MTIAAGIGASIGQMSNQPVCAAAAEMQLTAYLLHISGDPPEAGGRYGPDLYKRPVSKRARHNAHART